MMRGMGVKERYIAHELNLRLYVHTRIAAPYNHIRSSILNENHEF